MHKNFTNRAPKFSVIVPTYNHERYLGLALNTLLSQSYTDWEAVLVNDGSTDSTQSIMESYAAKDSRFRIVTKENGGVASALNAGLRAARGEWICWLSSDDMFESTKLEKHIQAINERPNIKFFHSHFCYLDDDTGALREAGRPAPIPTAGMQVIEFLRENYVHGNSFACHRSVFEDVGYFNEGYWNAQDFDMWLRIASKYELAYIPAVTCLTRLHPAQGTALFGAAGQFDSARSCLEFLNKNSFKGLFPFLDLTQPQNIDAAVQRTLQIIFDLGAFIYQGIGYCPALIDRLFEWIGTECPKEVRAPLLVILNNFLGSLGSPVVPARLKDAFFRIRELATKPVVYSSYNPLVEMRNNMLWLESIGNPHGAPIKRYLDRQEKIDSKLAAKSANPTKEEASSLTHLGLIPTCPEAIKCSHTDKRYHLKLLSSGTLIPDHTDLCRLEVVTQGEGIPYHTGVVSFDLLDPLNSLDPGGVEGTGASLCGPEIFKVWSNAYDFSKALAKWKAGSKDRNPSVAFVIRDGKVRSGGTSIIYRYGDWLSEMGITVRYYANDVKPTWREPPGEYLTIEDVRTRCSAIEESVIIVYSAIDIPDVLRYRRSDDQLIVHLCQGIESFHWGDTVLRLLDEKPIFDLLHALPVGRVVVSPHIQNYFRTRFSQESYLVTNSISSTFLEPISATPPTDRFRMLTVGNPEQYLKGFDCLWAGACEAARSMPAQQFELVLAGAPHGKYIPENAPPTNLKLTVLGQQDAESLQKLYQSSHVYLNASLYEGFGLPSLEAMGSGSVVIQANNNGLDSIAEHGKNCWVVEVGDSNAIATGIQELLIKPELRASLREGGIATARQYSIENQKKMFRTFIEALFGSECIGAANKVEHTRRSATLGIVATLSSSREEATRTLQSFRDNQSKLSQVYYAIGDTGLAAEFSQKFAPSGFVGKVYDSKSKIDVLNSAIESVTADWVALLDADQYLDKEGAARILATIAAYPDAKAFAFCYNGADRDQIVSVDVSGFPVAPLQGLYLLRKNSLKDTVLVIQKSALKEVGLLNKEYPFSYLYDLNLRVSSKFPINICFQPFIWSKWDPKVGLELGDFERFDEARAAYDFISRLDLPFHPVPMAELDVSSIEALMRVVVSTISDRTALMYGGIGYTSALSRKLASWIQSIKPMALQDQLVTVLQAIDLEIVPATLDTPLLDYIQWALNRDLNKLPPCPRDSVTAVREEESRLRAVGRYAEAAVVRRYLASIGAESTPALDVSVVEPTKFSVIVPVYNHAEFLPVAIESIQAQSYGNFEILVVDDGSTDDTPRVIERLAQSDSRITPIRKENGGTASALNLGLTQAKGDWICWLSADDIFEKHKLAIHARQAELSPQIKFFHSHFFMIDKDGKRKAAPNPPPHQSPPPPAFQVLEFFKWNYCHGNSFAAHRSLFEKVGNFNLSLPNGQDFEMWFRLSRITPFQFTTARTCVSRWYPGMGTTAFPEAGIYDSMRACLSVLNTSTFDKLFPFLDLSDPLNALSAVVKTLALVQWKDSFMYQGIGFVTPMLDRLGEWIYRGSSQKLRDFILATTRSSLESAISSDIPTSVRDALTRIYAGQVREYEPIDPLKQLRVREAELLEAGKIDEAKPIDKYFKKIAAHHKKVGLPPP